MRYLATVLWLPMLVIRASAASVHLSVADVQKPAAASDNILLSGRITAAVEGKFFILTDASGSVLINASELDGWKAGEAVKIRVSRRRQPFDRFFVSCREILSRQNGAAPDPPVPVSLANLQNEELDNHSISIQGTVTDVSVDELDSRFVYVSLETRESSCTLAVYRPDASTTDRLRGLIGTPVTAEGICVQNRTGFRRYLQCLVYADPGKISPLGEKQSRERFLRPEVQQGTVLAHYGKNAFYLHSDNGERFKVYLCAEESLPPVNASISVKGFLRTNIFFASLTKARVTPISDLQPIPERPSELMPHDLLYDKNGCFSIQVGYEGRPMRFRGTVQSILQDKAFGNRITVNAGGVDVPVRTGDLQTPPIGSEVEISGICSITSESDGNPYGFVRLTGFTLLTRGPEDVVILKNPPWWTPAKMLAVIAALLLLVVGILIWNKSLRTLAERRGRELMDEQLGRVAADLKVNERTRLAVELHDALSQNLTGVSLQLDAVKRFADEDRGKMARHLEMAMRTLKSCRDELRNCLWDLRNRALEETDMNEAIRRTASPFVGDAALFIRFNVPRDQISDNTAHALMRIIRELATNAVRHGAAKTIRIAGALENGRLLFSVSDDGSGFDPQRHPGVDEGHFGLDGIRERIENLGGSMEIESAPDKGSTIRISMTA